MSSSLATDRILAALSPGELRRIERTLRGVPPLFGEWCERAWPRMRWDWPHLRYLDRPLQRIIDGELHKLLVSMPPRHGKTEKITKRFPLYALLCDPGFRGIVGAYNAKLATKFTRQARTLALHSGIRISEDRDAADDWETTSGGGLRAAGVGTGVTGHGADGIVVDDPIKNREEAESLLYRDRVWEWFTNDIWTRREPGCWIIVTLTRWHDDDLIGRILEDPEIRDGWEVVNLPARARVDDPLGRIERAALCPDRYDEKALDEIETIMGPYAFGALYQGDPKPREGRMFPRELVGFVDAAPSNARRIRYWDKAGSEKSGDWTAGVLMAIAGTGIDQRVYVEHVERCQAEALKRRQRMKATAELDNPKERTRIPVWIEQEGGSGGKDSASDDVRNLAGFLVRAETVSGDKAVRAGPFSVQWQAGNVSLVRGEWNRRYLDELESFPHGKHDDQVDASSGAFTKLTQVEPGPRFLGSIQ